MGKLKVGDIVARKSYGGDIYFRVADIRSSGKEVIAVLKGIAYRIEADAPESDLIVMTDQKVKEYNMKMNVMVDKKSRQNSMNNKRKQTKKAFFRGTAKENTRAFSKPGKVLHIDGDSEYLETCLEQYRKFNIDAAGRHIPEKDQASSILGVLQECRPDILVLTGHDGFIKGRKDYSNIDNYWNSRYYADAVKEARRYDRDMDSLIIFAGACQSMYKEIIDAGANFASSPERVLIHALDPVFVCRKIAFGSIESVLDPVDVVKDTITGADGIGGLQTRGKCRNGYPPEPKN